MPCIIGVTMMKPEPQQCRQGSILPLEHLPHLQQPDCKLRLFSGLGLTSNQLFTM